MRYNACDSAAILSEGHIDSVAQNLTTKALEHHLLDALVGNLELKQRSRVLETKVIVCRISHRHSGLRVI